MSKSFLKDFIKGVENKKVDESFTNYLLGVNKLQTIKESFDNDEAFANELVLFIENDETLSEQIPSIKKNLFKHYKKAAYDTSLAERAWGRVVNEGAKRYAERVGHEPRLWKELFTEDVRRVVIEKFEQSFRKDLFKGKVNMEELFNE